MQKYTSSISPKGQVKIPAEVCARLKLKDQITFLVDGDDVRLLPPAFTLETAYGSVPALSPSRDFDDIQRLARDEHIAHLINEVSGK